MNFWFVTFISILPALSYQRREVHTSCASFKGNSLFLSSTSGRDSKTCGLSSAPCRKISYAVRNAIYANYSSVVVNISIGIYKELDVISLDCGRLNLKRITFLGERQGKQMTQVDISIYVQLCDVRMSNLHWINSQPVLHNVLLSNFSLCESSAQETEISIIGKSSNLVFQSVTISKSTGYQKLLPLISLTSFPGNQNTLLVNFCNYTNNIGPLFIVESTFQTSIIHSYFEKNIAYFGENLITLQFSHLNISDTKFLQNNGTVLRLRNSASLNANDCLFQQNEGFSGSILEVDGLSTVGLKDCIFKDSRSYKDGPVMRILDSHSSAHLERCNFSCNLVNARTFVPPVMLQSAHQLSCVKCFVDPNCPVHCSPGEYLTDSILCKACRAGTFSPGISGNTSVMQCTSCPAGTYSAKTKTQICTNCSEGMFSSKRGSLMCSKCKNDFFTSAPGQASCSKVTLEFVVLLLLSAVLTVLPLAFLLWQRGWTVSKQNGGFLISSNDTSKLLEEDSLPNVSIQGGYRRVARTSLTNFPA